jgi:hypothetical protein
MPLARVATRDVLEAFVRQVHGVLRRADRALAVPPAGAGLEKRRTSTEHHRRQVDVERSSIASFSSTGFGSGSG